MAPLPACIDMSYWKLHRVKRIDTVPSVNKVLVETTDICYHKVLSVFAVKLSMVLSGNSRHLRERKMLGWLYMDTAILTVRHSE